MRKVKPFPEIRALMARYGLSQSELAKVISTSYQTFGAKLNFKKDFTFNEMWNIQQFFASYGESYSIDALFFNWKVHNNEHKESF